MRQQGSVKTVAEEERTDTEKAYREGLNLNLPTQNSERPRKAYGIRNFRYFVLKIRETFPGKGTSLWIGYPPGIAFLKTRVWSAYEQLDTYFPTKP